MSWNVKEITLTESVFCAFYESVPERRRKNTQCPFHHVPEHGSFTVLTACIGRDIL